MISPKQKELMGKIYEIIAVSRFTGKEPQIFEEGDIYLKGEEANTPKGYKIKPAKFEILDEKLHKARLTLFEGKYHQIKRMLSAIGNKARAIHRSKVGPVTLGDLKPGEWRFLTNEELDQIRKLKIQQAPTQSESKAKTTADTKVPPQEQSETVEEIDEVMDLDDMMRVEEEQAKVE